MLTSIAVSPLAIPLAAGSTTTLVVTAAYSDGTHAVLGSGETYQSSNTAVATVSTSGVVTGISAGTANITATDTATGKTTASPAVVTVTDGLVFYNGAFDTGVSFVPFAGPIPDLAVDPTRPFNGSASLKMSINATGTSSGGAFTADTDRDLHTFNALTFYASAGRSTNSLEVGIGNNGTAAPYSAEMRNLILTANFTQYILPLPDPSKYTGADGYSVNGLFHYVLGPNNYILWFNNVQYRELPSTVVGPPSAAGATWPGAQSMQIGSAYQIPYVLNTVTFDMPAVVLTNVAWRWFTLSSSNPGVATVTADGLVTAVADGTTVVTAVMNGITVNGSLTINVTSGALAVPTTIAATPTIPASNVISLFSSAYPQDPRVQTWLASGSTTAELVDPYLIGNHAVKQYTLHDLASVEFLPDLDASTMTTFHIDVWSPNPSSNFKLQLLRCDPPGACSAGYFSAGVITAGTWVSLEIPLADFGLGSLTKLIRLQFSVASPSVLYVDNVYFHN